MKRLGWIAFMLAVIAITWVASRVNVRSNQMRTESGESGERVVRFYDISDLIPQAVDDEESPLIVAARNVGPPAPLRRGGGTPTILPTREEARIEQLKIIITRSVAPGTWNAGEGSIVLFTKCLVIVQTRENQKLIADLLQQLRLDSPRHVRVEAIWAYLSGEEFGRLVPPRNLGSTAQTVDLDALSAVPGAIAWRGQTTCLNGQQERIACGKTRTILGKVEAEAFENTIGFSAKTQQLLDGAMLEVTPSLDGDGSTVLLDVRSEVTRIGSTQSPAIEFPAGLGHPVASTQPLKLDRLNLGVQTISTSVRGPTGATIFVGGTNDPDAGGSDAKRLYLFVRTIKVESKVRR